MDASLNIVDLIENNPITRLNSNYQNKFICKIKENFSDNEQQMFVASFYCYLKYDRKNDFVIDLDDVWKWLGFSQKVNAKSLLEKNFIIDKDYSKSLLLLQQKQSNNVKGGHNKEKIMLTIRTFKLFCLKAGTEKAEQIHEYYIKLEEILQEILEEESNELRLQLEQKEVEIKNIEIDKDKIREKTLLEHFSNNIQCVYYGTIDNVSNNSEKLIKFGNSNNLKNRVMKHKDTYVNFRLINAFKVDNKLQIENALKENSIFMERQRTITIKNKKYVELLTIDGLAFAEMDKIIKDIIMNIEYSPENYKKILEENYLLKKQLEEKNENNNTHHLILVETENKRLKMENIKLIKKCNIFIKKIKKNNDFIEKIDENVIKQHESEKDENDVENYDSYILNTTLNNNNNKKNGSYNIEGKIYEKLYGSRQDVWDGIVYKTSGGLVKSDLMKNSIGKIVSKKKSILETVNKRFEKCGVNKQNEKVMS